MNPCANTLVLSAPLLLLSIASLLFPTSPATGSDLGRVWFPFLSGCLRKFCYFRMSSFFLPPASMPDISAGNTCSPALPEARIALSKNAPQKLLQNICR